MAFKRFIHPEMFSSPDLVSLPFPARWLFVGLFGKVADDEGRGKADPAYLKAEIFPLDRVSVRQVVDWRGELARLGMIRLYRDDEGRDLFDIPTWTRWQRPKYVAPSKFKGFNDPANPGKSRENPATGKGWVGLGREGLGRGGLGRGSGGGSGGEPASERQRAVPPGDQEPNPPAPVTHSSTTGNGDSPEADPTKRRKRDAYRAGLAALRKAGVAPAITDQLEAEERQPDGNSTTPLDTKTESV